MLPNKVQLNKGKNMLLSLNRSGTYKSFMRSNSNWCLIWLHQYITLLIQPNFQKFNSSCILPMPMPPILQLSINKSIYQKMNYFASQTWNLPTATTVSTLLRTEYIQKNKCCMLSHSQSIWQPWYNAVLPCMTPRLIKLSVRNVHGLDICRTKQ